MKKHYKFILFFLLVVILLASFWAFQRYKKDPKENSSNELYFLKTYGSINYIQGQSNNINLAFIASSSINFEEDITTLGFDNPDISSDNIFIKKSFSYKNYTLWYLQFDVVIDTTKNVPANLAIHKVSLNSFLDKELGNLTINMIDGNNNLFSELELQSCAGASMGVNLSDYHAKLKNNSKNTLTINSIYVPMFDDATFSLKIGNNTYNSLNDAVVKPNQNVILTISLSDSSDDSVNVYYVSPLLTYHNTVTGNDTCMAFHYYTSGLNITETQFADIINKYSQM